MQPRLLGKDFFAFWQGGDFISSCMALDSGGARWLHAARDAMPARGEYIASQLRVLPEDCGYTAFVRAKLPRMCSHALHSVT